MQLKIIHTIGKFMMDFVKSRFNITKITFIRFTSQIIQYNNTILKFNEKIYKNNKAHSI